MVSTRMEMAHDALYDIYRRREAQALAGYRRGVVTAGECQYESCLAAIAALRAAAPRPPGARRLPIFLWKRRTGESRSSVVFRNCWAPV
jgi:hypothetical protein